MRRFLVLAGEGKGDFAARLGLDARTLSRWEKNFELKEGIWRPRGRRVERSSPKCRNGVVHALELLGPQLSARKLLAFFDDMARSEVLDIQECYRRWHARLHPMVLHELTWSPPGAVWAMDHAVPPEPVDGTCPWLFALRDLASGYQILWESAEDCKAVTVMESLERCFRLWGPPLVLKSDSGSAFIAEVLEDLLLSWGVKHILSPPRRPQYNGAAEASIRWMKVGTEREADAAGRAGAWRREDMERARQRANTALRRHSGVAEELWLSRSAIGAEARAAFAATVERERLAALVERGLSPDQPIAKLLARAVNRDAIRRALVAHDILHFKRRLIPLPIKHTIADTCG